MVPCMLYELLLLGMMQSECVTCQPKLLLGGRSNRARLVQLLRSRLAVHNFRLLYLLPFGLMSSCLTLLAGVLCNSCW